MCKSPRFCPECGSEVEPKSTPGQPRVFCSAAHKQAHNNRMAVRGKSLTKIALGWRKTRGSGDFGKFLFAEMCKMLDAWNAEDLTAGRMPSDEYANLVTSGFTSASFMDRRAERVHCTRRFQGCHEKSTTSMGVNVSVAKKMARNQGWIFTSEGEAVCPNCQD